MSATIFSGEVVFSVYFGWTVLPESDPAYKQVEILRERLARDFHGRRKPSNPDLQNHIRSKLEQHDPSLPALEERAQQYVGRCSAREVEEVANRGTWQEAQKAALARKDNVNQGIRKIAQEAKAIEIEEPASRPPLRLRGIIGSLASRTRQYVM